MITEYLFFSALDHLGALGGRVFDSRTARRALRRIHDGETVPLKCRYRSADRPARTLRGVLLITSRDVTLASEATRIGLTATTRSARVTKVSAYGSTVSVETDDATMEVIVWTRDGALLDQLVNALQSRTAATGRF
ncbi:hypothetical protein [Streptomyces sp. NBC_01207]|uniref:hypothetical protein n=1 Tax=Streptomyces sp. NBC_01207 TaxID=2903772 RepID=UPI002E154EA7|nr:hypothetical protein OG457_06045 [Streptomyces sp. NBC_01207]